ncbi:hypothetical protein ACLX1H_000189 [Fusarium chlamydosporum]
MSTLRKDLAQAVQRRDLKLERLAKYRRYEDHLYQAIRPDAPNETSSFMTSAIAHVARRIDRAEKTLDRVYQAVAESEKRLAGPASDQRNLEELNAKLLEIKANISSQEVEKDKYEAYLSM